MIQVSEYLKTKTIFDSTSLTSYDFIDTNICNALNNVFGIKYNKMYLIDDNANTIHCIVNDTILLNSAKYNDIYRSMNLDPLKEFSETKTNTGTQTNANTGTQTNVNTGTQTNANTGTQTNVNTGTQTNANTGTQTNANTGTQTEVLTPSVVSTVDVSKNTANSAMLRPIEETVTSSTGTDDKTRTDNLLSTVTDNLTSTRTDNLTATRTDDLTSTRTDNLTATRTDDLTSTRTDNLTNTRTDALTNTRTDNLTETRAGYNNVFDNVEKLFRFANMELYDMIIIDVMKATCYPIYDINDLAF